MKKSAKVTLILGILSLALAVAFPILATILPDRNTSIGIIGGADGPTAVFIVSKLKYQFLGGILLLLVSVVCFVISFIIKKKSRK